MEFVFVVPRAELFPDCYPQGLAPFGSVGEGFSRERFEEAVREHGFFVERAYAEKSPHLKQIIPYTLVTRGPELLLMKRLARSGEARLRDKLSIGVGGHINPEDLGDDPNAVRDPIAAGSRREIEEELRIEGETRLQAVGLLNDDSNPVGAVHVGWVQVLAVQGEVAIREEDVLEGRLVTREELRRLRAEGADIETWSAILIDRIDEIVSQPLPALS